MPKEKQPKQQKEKVFGPGFEMMSGNHIQKTTQQLTGDSSKNLQGLGYCNLGASDETDPSKKQ